MSLLLLGCDSYIPISITNKKNEVIKVCIKENTHFLSDKQPKLKTKDGFSVYELASGERMEIGDAIAELDNDIPFYSIRICTSNDTISRNTHEDIKALFDKKTFGGLQTPYNISVK